METDNPRVSREELLYQLYLAAKPKKELMRALMKMVAEGAFGEEAWDAYWKGYAKGYAEGYAETYVVDRKRGLAEVRGVLQEMLVRKSNRKFHKTRPVGTELKPQFARIRDLKTLKQLYFDLDEIADADALQARLDELAPENKLKANFQTPQ